MDIADRLTEILDRINSAALRVGRNPDEIQLVAVSKTHPPEAVQEAYEAGQRIFGESRVQELLAKAPSLPSSIRWHFIGHLQANKIRKLLPVSELVHGVDSPELALDIDRVAADLGLFPRVLLEVNVSGEGTKFGFKPDVLRARIDELLALPRVQIEGLMAIPAPVADPEEVRPAFRLLRELRDEISAASGTPLPVLSMGMSGDYEIAIEEGATLVRVGTAIFGHRPKPGAEL
ncbi:MAG: YggS family pyridoxal phosphate enzyme [Verrucomicrobia bacterium 61-8]|nr:YggS family pyridoxal phosphate-dependent enzyme [Verrucomicrobiota bacterium]OJV10130.1 MAG: YggS family pyridoxal phosphate enzyme [Verrucomicrobia bacterium 61-8]